MSGQRPYPAPWVWEFQYSITTLSQDEMEWCHNHARELLEWNKNNTVDRKIDRSKSELEVDVQGMIGQFGYHKILWRDPIQHMKILDHIDPGYDDVIHGKKVQIKSTYHKEVWMILSAKVAKMCDFAVRMRVWDNKVRAVGYLSTKEFDRLKRTDKRVSRYVVHPSVHEREFNYIFWLPFHCKFGDKWVRWWKDKVKKC